MYIVVFPQFLWRYAIPYWCELIFILEITGIPEPADRECQEAHTLRCCIIYLINEDPMKSKIIDGNEVLFFEDDAEFEEFCIAPYVTICRSESGDLYTKGDYSDSYKECVKKGVQFMIKNTDSKVFRRQVACRRVPLVGEGVLRDRNVMVQLPVNHMLDYWEYLNSIRK